MVAVEEWAFLGLGLLTEVIKLLGGVRIGVRTAFFDELFRPTVIDIETVRLFVWTGRAILARAEIVVDPERLKALDDVVDRTLDFTVLVSVFDAKDKRTVSLTSE